VNRDWILFHLHEALEELQRTVRDIEEDPEYGEPELAVALTHLYHHVNTAWNSRAASDEENADASEQEFYRRRRFPDDIHLGM
jgi:hypothetical protein